MRGRPSGRSRLRQLQWWIAGLVVCSLVATVAVLSAGYDARETPREEPGVWVMREAGQYARVNTDTGELDLVRKASAPSDVVQSGSLGAVLTNGNGRVWPIDSADPADLTDASATDASATDGEEAEDASGDGTEATAVVNGEPAGAVRMPDGTREVLNAGRYVAVRTEAGAVYVGALAPLAPAAGTDAASGAADLQSGAADLAERLNSLVRVEPLLEDEAEAGAESVYRAAAIALTESGELAMYSSDEHAVRRYDAVERQPIGTRNDIEDGDGIAAPQLSLIGKRWALLDGESGALWREGRGRVSLEVEGAAVLQASATASTVGDGGGDAVLVADSDGLIRVGGDGATERTVETRGTPARPTSVAGAVYAAWLGRDSGVLWSSETGERALQVDGSVQAPGDLAPVFRSNGSRAVLNEVRTGMLWTLPQGELIPLSQWNISDPPQENRGQVVVDETSEQVPPTAVDDAFGVRAGEAVPLPVMLNDFDANRGDVLTIVPESLGDEPLPESFGALQLPADAQQLTVQMAPGATGSATFSYRITDGALQSESASVTLTVADEQTNSAPEWCPVVGCQREWRVPAMAPGGTLVYPVLEGWVDPEGDVSTLSAVEPVSPDDPVRAIVTADGRLAIRHTDSNADESEFELRVTVRDSRGEEATRELQVAVEPEAPPEFSAMAATVQVDRLATVLPLERVAGGSGSYALVDAVSANDAVRVATRESTGEVEVQADAEGGSTVTLTVRDTVTGAETTGALRVTAIASSLPLALPPLRAFVRPLSDTTVDVLDAIPGASSRVLAVQGARVLDGELQADVVGHAQVRVAGSTADGAAGRIGSAEVTVAEGDAQAQGRLTVFQSPETGDAGAIAVADAATVRAGSVVDIPVLENDIAAPGERLMLHPDVAGSGEAGELAFASGRVLRYLAPEKAGTYRLSYTAFGASDPDAGDVGAVIVQVLPSGANQQPQPPTLTARVSPGSTTRVQVPLSGVDPDGDRVRLVSVRSDGDRGIAATMNATGTGLNVSASAAAEPGLVTLEYTVRDQLGATASGALHVMVMPAGSTGALIASTDQVRLTPGNGAAVVRPLENDIDPAGGELSIVSVVPNVVGGEQSPEYRDLMSRLDVSKLEDGIVVLRPGKTPGTVSYRYTIASQATTSTVDGLIVVQTSERVGAQAPAVTDTVLNVRDRADLGGKGVDVVSEKVRWATGDAASLELSLWGDSDEEYRVSGSRIIGEYRPEGDTVVFRVTGTDISGAKVSSYGLLIVPPLDELQLTLKPGLKPLTVDENRQVEAQVLDLVDIDPSERVELRQAVFSTGRSQATCEAISADRVRYSAGGEAPWSDICLIEARMVGQQQWTTLGLPVTIVPKEPAVQATALTRTIAPGASDRIDLGDMVAWQGGREGDAAKLRFAVSGAGKSMTVRQDGPRLEVAARADAVPGSLETLSVVVSGAGESRAPLTLRVSQAPRDLPRGGTVALQCTVGSRCETQLVGVPGEHDPFAGKSGGGLRLVSVSGRGCTFGAFTRVGDTSVSVEWPGGREIGGTCKVGFTVMDAQGRTGQGTLEFDAQGIPSRPSIQQTGYTKSSASFAVTLGNRSAHPSVTGVSLSGGGSTRCEPSGPAMFRCTATGLVAGEKHEFTATAENEAGDSEPSNAVTAWAYAAPDRPTVSVEPVKNPRNTDQGRGAVRLTVQGSDDTKQFKILYRGQDGGVIEGSSGSREYSALEVGRVTFTVTPVTRFDVPSIGGGTSVGAAAQAEGLVIGAPKLSGAALTSTGSHSARATTKPGEAGLAHGGEQVKVRYAIGRPSEQLDCWSSANTTGVFEGLSGMSRKFVAAACATSDFGRSGPVVSDAVRIGDPPPAPSGERSYTVAPAPTMNGDSTEASYLESAPRLEPNGAGVVQYRIDGAVTTRFELSGNSIPVAEARQCVDPADEDTCSPWEMLRPETAPTRVHVSVAAGACYSAERPPNDLRSLFVISPAAREYARVDFEAPAAGATTVQMHVRWTGPFAALESATLNVCYEAPPEPEPPAPEPPEEEPPGTEPPGADPPSADPPEDESPEAAPPAADEPPLTQLRATP